MAETSEYSVSAFLCLAELNSPSYLIELRNIAVNRRAVSVGLHARMKRSAFLLASRRVKRNQGKAVPTNEIDDEENWELEYDLLKPDSVVIVDDTNAFQHFGEQVFAAPQEDILEG